METIPGNSRNKLILVILALLVAAVFWQVGDHAFINFDDNGYVYENPVVRKGLTADGIAWAFTATGMGNWHPLTWLSHMTDVSLFGGDAGWHHRVNALFHLLNTLLLFLLLERMTGAPVRSGFVAALFAVHPLHVESVAWIAERKDVLSTFFWLLATGAYVRFVRRRSVPSYLAVVALFALGLMAKPMLVTLPFTLLLLDFWPLGRVASPALLPRLALEKAPLFALSAASCVVTWIAQSEGGAVRNLVQLPFGARAANALTSVAGYLRRVAWPDSLSMYYPHPGSIHASIPAWKVAGAAALVAALTAFALREAGRRPFLATGWLWFLGTLVPVIGLVQVGAQAMADRYTYVPLIGLFIAIVWGAHDLLGSWRLRDRLLPVAGGLAVAALAVAAWAQAGYWRDGVTLYTHAIRSTENNWLAWNNLGSATDDLGNGRQAVEAYREALRIKPDYTDAWINLGATLGAQRQFAEAAECLQRAVALAPDNHRAWYNLGVTHEALGQTGQAIDALHKSLDLRPDFAEGWYALGLFGNKAGDQRIVEEAVRRLQQLDPARARSLRAKLGTDR
jgi:tetratricopeptide (TPR) repeat protein